MRRRDLIAHHAAHDCHLVREGGRHSWYGDPTNGRRSAVPRHSEINDHLARQICRDLGIPEP